MIQEKQKMHFYEMQNYLKGIPVSLNLYFYTSGCANDSYLPKIVESVQ